MSATEFILLHGVNDLGLTARQRYQRAVAAAKAAAIQRQREQVRQVRSGEVLLRRVTGGYTPRRAPRRVSRVPQEIRTRFMMDPSIPESVRRRIPIDPEAAAEAKRAEVRRRAQEATARKAQMEARWRATPAYQKYEKQRTEKLATEKVRAAFREATGKLPIDVNIMMERLFANGVYSQYSDMPGYHDFQAGRIRAIDMMRAVLDDYRKFVSGVEVKRAAERAAREAARTRYPAPPAITPLPSMAAPRREPMPAMREERPTMSDRERAEAEVARRYGRRLPAAARMRIVRQLEKRYAARRKAAVQEPVFPTLEPPRIISPIPQAVPELPPMITAPPPAPPFMPLPPLM